MSKREDICDYYPNLSEEEESEHNESQRLDVTIKIEEKNESIISGKQQDKEEAQDEQLISKKRNRFDSDLHEEEREKPTKLPKKDDCQSGEKLFSSKSDFNPQRESANKNLKDSDLCSVISSSGQHEPMSFGRNNIRSRLSESEMGDSWYRRKTKNTLYLKNIPYFLQNQKKIKDFFMIEGCRVISILITGSYAEIEFKSRNELQNFIRKGPHIVGRSYIKYGKDPKNIQIKDAENQARVIGQHRLLNNITDQQWNNLNNYLEKAIAPCYRFMLYLIKNGECFEDLDEFVKRVEADMEICRNFKEFITSCGIVLNQYVEQFQAYEAKIENQYSLIFKFQQDFDPTASLQKKQTQIRQQFSALFNIDPRTTNMMVIPKKKNTQNIEKQEMELNVGEKIKDTIHISCLSGRQFLLAYLYICHDESGKNRSVLMTPSVEKIQKIALIKSEQALQEIKRFLKEKDSIKQGDGIDCQKIKDQQPKSGFLSEENMAAREKNEALEKLKQKLRLKKEKKQAVKAEQHNI